MSVTCLAKVKDTTTEFKNTQRVNNIMNSLNLSSSWPIGYGYMLASFLSSRAWAEKKSLVHNVCACLVPPGFLGIWKFP